MLPSERQTFPSADALGVPIVATEDFVPSYLVPHRQKIRTDRPVAGGAVHFFLDDERFEPVWKTPEKGFSYVKGVGAALTPDFSLYPEIPLALQLFNVYRNRWCGAFWQSRGVRVIPTVGWSDESSYSFCFLGVEEGSTVAVSTVGLGRSEDPATERARHLFRAGYEEMVRRIEPSLVLLYGDSPQRLLLGLSELASDVPTREYPSRWHSIRAERKRVNEDRLSDVV